MRGWENDEIDEMGGEGMLGVQQDVVLALRVVGTPVALRDLLVIVLVDLPATGSAVSVLSCGDGVREAGGVGRRDDEVNGRHGLDKGAR